MANWVEIQLAPPTDVLTAYSDLAQHWPALVNTNFRRYAVRIVKPRVLVRLQIVPGPVVYSDNGHLRWKSQKQRRAFFASDGFGSGIPTARTGIYQSSFDVEVNTDDFGGFLVVTNSDPKAPFVGGDEQQPFHIDTGYPAIAVVVADESERVEDESIELFFTLAEPEALFR